MPLVTRLEELDFELEDLPRTTPPDRVLMADPAEFEVAYAINPHMVDDGGVLKTVDRARAREQWGALREALGELGYGVDVVPSLPGSPDLVFCANQVLPIPAEGAHGPRALASRMAHPERRAEVAHVSAFLEELGVEVLELEDPEAALEGMGDGLWHPGRRLLWAGVGTRSNHAAWEEVARRFELPVVELQLATRELYHLDTALALLDESTCLWTPEALEPESRALVTALVPRRIEADPEDAGERLACNAFCPNGRHVLLQRGSERTRAAIEAHGFTVVELDTDEFLKAGGSVFCMKLLHGPL